MVNGTLIGTTEHDIFSIDPDDPTRGPQAIGFINTLWPTKVATGKIVIPGLPRA